MSVLTNLLSGTTVLLGLSGGAQVAFPDLGVSSGLPALSDAQWALLDEPSITGDTAMVDIYDYPSPDGWYVDALKVRVVETGIETVLRNGGRTSKIRHIRVPALSTYNVQTAALYRNENDPARAEVVQGAWSSPKPGRSSIGPMSVTITATRYNRCAPAGYMFTAEVRGSGKLHPFNELGYEWDYGDLASLHRRQSQAMINVFGNGASMSANTSFDPIGAHTYRTPSAVGYTATLTVFDADGNEATATYDTGAVEDIRDAFGEFDTVFIDTRHTNGQPVAPEIRADIEAAGFVFNENKVYDKLSSARYSLRFKDQGCYMFARDQVHESTLGYFNEEIRRYVGAYGTGTDPIIDWNLNWIGPGSGVTVELDYCVTGIRFDGGYDPSAPVVGDEPNSLLDVNQPCMIDDCYFTGGFLNISITNNRGSIISDCVSTNYSEHALSTYFPENTAVYGCDFSQNPFAIRVDDGNVSADDDGDGIKDGFNVLDGKFYANHGPTRINDLRGDFLYMKCRMTNSIDWANLDTSQPNIRMGANGKMKNGFYVCTQCMFEGGITNLSATAGNAGGDYGDIRIAKCVSLMSISPSFIFAAFGGIQIEACIYVVPQVVERAPRYLLGWGDTHVPSSYGNPSYSFSRNHPNEAQFYLWPPILQSCAAVDLRPSASVIPLTSVSEPTTDPILRNNLLSGPCFDQVVTGLDLSVDYVSLYPGRLARDENGGDLQTQFATQSSATLARVQAGSSAIGAGSGPASLQTFDGRRRYEIMAANGRVNPSLGPWEYDG